ASPERRSNTAFSIRPGSTSTPNTTRVKRLCTRKTPGAKPITARLKRGVESSGLLGFCVCIHTLLSGRVYQPILQPGSQQAVEVRGGVSRQFTALPPFDH